MPNPDALYMQPGQFGLQPPFTLDQLGGGAVSGGVGMGMLGQYNQNMDLQTQMNQMVQQANQARMGEYDANAPLRDMQRALELMYAGPEREQKFKTGAADLGTKEEELARKQALRPSDIEKGIEANLTASEESRIKRLQTQLDKLSAESSNWTGPDALARASKWMDDNKVPENHPLRAFARQPGLTPEKFQAGISMMQNRLAMATANRGEMIKDVSKIKAQGAETYRTQEMVKQWDYMIALVAQGRATKQDIDTLLKTAFDQLHDAENKNDQEGVQTWRRRIVEITNAARAMKPETAPYMQLPPNAGVNQVPRQNPPVFTPPGNQLQDPLGLRNQ